MEIKRRSLFGMLAGMFVASKVELKNPELPADVDEKDLPQYNPRYYIYGGNAKFPLMTKEDMKRYKRYGA